MARSHGSCAVPTKGLKETEDKGTKVIGYKGLAMMMASSLPWPLG